MAPLGALLTLLDDRFRVFVHLDAKTELPEASLRLPPHASLVLPRLPVFWGGWSMMQATLALIAAAQSEGNFDQLVLVSGDSLPVLPADELHARLLDSPQDFIELLPVANDSTLADLDRASGIARHGWVQPWRFHNFVHLDHRLLNPFQRAEAAAHYRLPQDQTDWLRGDVEALTNELLRRQPPRSRLFRTFWYGAQWWALRGETLAAILPSLHDPAVQHFFRNMEVPDEHMVQTVLANLRPNAVPEASGTPMFTDHARRATGQATLDASGFQTARARGYLFARKFDPAAAADVAAAIAAGRYAADVLGG